MNAHSTRSAWRSTIAATAVAMLTACAATSPQPSRIDVDALAGTEVTSDSDAHITAARALQQACRLDAEFGRCGCTLDGFRASCEFVQSCLDAGFCEVAR